MRLQQQQWAVSSAGRGTGLSWVCHMRILVLNSPKYQRRARVRQGKAIRWPIQLWQLWQLQQVLQPQLASKTTSQASRRAICNWLPAGRVSEDQHKAPLHHQQQQVAIASGAAAFASCCCCCLSKGAHNIAAWPQFSSQSWFWSGLASFWSALDLASRCLDSPLQFVFIKHATFNCHDNWHRQQEQQQQQQQQY